MPLIRRTPGAAAAAETPDVAAALARLESSTVDERWDAARTLASFPAAAGRLGEAAAVEPDDRVREALFTSLARIDDEAAVEALLAHVRSDDAARRTGAMDALKTMPRTLAGAVARLLAEADPDVRGLACDLARELPAREATAVLAALLDRETVVNVCAAAVEVIAEIGSVEALPHLRRCAGRFPGEPFLAFAVRIACDRIGRAPPDG